MAVTTPQTLHGLGWQKDSENATEGGAPGSAQAFVLVPVDSPPTYDPGHDLSPAMKMLGKPYTISSTSGATGQDVPRSVERPYNPSITLPEFNFNLDILKRLFVAIGNSKGSSLGAGSTGTCYQLDCPSVPFTYRYSSTTNSGTDSKRLIYVEDRQESGSTGRYMSGAIPRAFTFKIPADGSPVRMSAELQCGLYGDVTTSGMTISPTTTYLHADIGPSWLTAYSLGSLGGRSGIDMELRFEVPVSGEHNGYRNPQDLTVPTWKITGKIGDIDLDTVAWDDFEAGDLNALTIHNDWDATPGNNGPENWKISLPNCRITNPPQLEGEARLYTTVEFEAVQDGSDNLWEFYYNTDDGSWVT